MLVGRDGELRLTKRMLDDVAAGRGGALLIRGFAGVGKSALLQTLRSDAAARGFKVLTASGVEGERDFPFAALPMLLRPLTDRTGGLPAEHQRALAAAFAGHGDVYRAGLAVFALVAGAAAERPVLLLVDDLTWVDRMSREVLAFVARRARSHALLIAGAARSFDRPDGSEYTDLHLGPLDRAASAALLEVRAPELPPSTRMLLAERAAGNPLALVELPKVVRTSADLIDELPLTYRLADAFAARTDLVSPACRVLLLVLAAEPCARLGLLLSVTSELTGSAPATDPLQEAIDAGLVVPSGTGLQFRHPLMRAATYARARLADRLATHRALAAALAGSGDQELLHRAKATLGPDEDLAIRLEAMADVAVDEGRPGAAVPSLRQAAALVGDGRRRTAVLVRAAQLAAEVGDRPQALALLGQADLNLAGPVEQARLIMLHDDPAPRIDDLVRAAATARQEGVRDVADGLLWMAGAWCAFQEPDQRARAELIRWAPRSDDLVALSVRSFAEPYRYGMDVLNRLGEPDDGDARTAHYLGVAAMILGDFSNSARLLSQAAGQWRRQGRLFLLARALTSAGPRIWLGELDRARAEAGEGRALAADTGERIVWLNLTAKAAVAAATAGDLAAAHDLVRELRGEGIFARTPFATVRAQQAEGLLALLEGSADAAYALLRRVFRPGDRHYHSLSRWQVAADLADAAVAADLVEPARELLTELPSLARQLPSEMMVSALAYTEAVLADDREAEQRYVSSLAVLPPTAVLLRARLHLHHGRWLRKQRRYLDAREPLRIARDEFERCGAAPWAVAAREQLRASGAGTGRRSLVGESLSDQELQIAVLASQGLSNREIGQRLFISFRTVSSHLYRVFPRLGVTSRGQLAAALASAGVAVESFSAPSVAVSAMPSAYSEQMSAMY